ncbi:MAG TPA: SRPBCC family protein [Gammaproteobacteria bacterium]|nr:SRPBCC family protein [Gammaproteobacteria bacterium]
MSARAIKPAPVRRSIEVRASQAKAFEVFTRRTSAWWPKTHHIGKAALAEAIIEPRAGGRWYERGEDGSECEWGRVIAWNPPEAVTLAWQLDASFRFDPALVTEVEVRFVALSPSLTRVELEHRNLDRFGERADDVRNRIGAEGGWTAILRGFAQAAEA